MSLRVWTKEKLDWLIDSKKIYDDRVDILHAFNKHFDTNLSLKTLRNVSTVYKLNLPKANKIIANGLKQGWVALRGFDFKNIGDDIKRGSANQTFIKLPNECYVLKKRYLYEQYHNVKLQPNEIIVFLNGDYNDFSIDNLYKVSHKAHTIMATKGFYKKNKIANLGRINACEWKIKLNLVRSGIFADTKR